MPLVVLPDKPTKVKIQLLNVRKGQKDLQMRFPAAYAIDFKVWGWMDSGGCKEATHLNKKYNEIKICIFTMLLCMIYNMHISIMI